MSSTPAKEKMEPVRSHRINDIIDRLHVYTPLMELMRVVTSKLEGGRKAWLKGDKTKRRYVCAAVIQRRARNLHEYRYVMGTVPRAYPAFHYRYLWRASDKTVHIVEPE